MTQADTLPKHLLERVRQYGDRKIAMRQKDYGIWKPFTWQDSYEHVRDFCLGLVELGLQRGDKVCIIGDNDPQYFWAQLAIQSAGGVAVGIFTDSIPSEIEYIVGHCDATFVLAKDQEQCDKLLEIKDSVPAVQKVIYWESRGLWNYDEPWLVEFAAVESQGHRVAVENPNRFETLVAQGSGDDLAIFCYTSGTTDLPKGAMIAHKNLLGGAMAALGVDPRCDSDEYLSFLPPAWITENALGLTVHVLTGMIISFPESPETVQDNIREIAPNALLFSSRLWESLVSMVQVRINDSTDINRWLYRLFLPVGYRVADMRFARKNVPILWRILYRLGDLAVFHPLRDKLGLIRVNSAYTAGAALSPDVVRFFRAIGVNIKQLYGSTEVQIHTLHVGEDVKFESVGVPPPDVEIRISDEGEILVKAPSVFQGYYKAPDKTAEKLKDGWFYTGDAGYIDEDGHLIYLDRVDDLLELKGGEKFSPQYIEGRLKFSPYIKDLMSIGGRELEYVTAIINIDFDNVGRWAEKRGIAYTTFVDLSQRPEVYDLIRADVERVNKSLPPAARVRKFVLMHKEFDPDEAELTRTRKLRRGFVEQRYRQMIEAMYTGLDEVRVRAEVKYRDGRQGVVETPIRVCSLDVEEVAA
ncbi:MAG: AMP-binding protein [Anaerolineae bacterium]|jgi:long-chain acyl-CoA synthetase